MFDALREEEESLYGQTRKLLGESFCLVEDLLNLYDVFLKLSVKPVAKLDDAERLAPMLHCLQWMKNEAITAVLTMMRGHIADSSNYTRRAIEIAAFVAYMFKNGDAAKRWMAAGASDEARKEYVKSFMAYKIVKQELTPYLIGNYEDYCLDVHPSFFGCVNRASLDEDYVHRFAQFDLSPTDGYQTFFVSNFLRALVCHAKLMEHLTTVFYSSGHFDAETWTAAYLPFVQKFQIIDQYWRPFFADHFARTYGEEMTHEPSP